MPDLTKLATATVTAVTEQATAAARDGAASLYARCTKAPNGKASLTIKITALACDGKVKLGTKWSANAADKDSDDLPDRTIDPEQPDLINNKGE